MNKNKTIISHQAGDIDTNLCRDTQWFYPLEAIREVLVNALAHRDWTRFVEIEVGSYSNRFEVISPGAYYQIPCPLKK